MNALLEQARAKNLKNEITGVLIYVQGSFIQLLEGEEPALSETFSRIATDTRHTGLMKLSDRNVEKRSFPDLQMGFRLVSEKELSEDPDLFVKAGGNWSVSPASDLDTHLRVIFETFFKINVNARY